MKNSLQKLKTKTVNSRPTRRRGQQKRGKRIGSTRRRNQCGGGKPHPIWLSTRSVGRRIIKSKTAEPAAIHKPVDPYCSRDDAASKSTHESKQLHAIQRNPKQLQLAREQLVSAWQNTITHGTEQKEERATQQLGFFQTQSGNNTKQPRTAMSGEEEGVGVNWPNAALGPEFDSRITAILSGVASPCSYSLRNEVPKQHACGQAAAEPTNNNNDKKSESGARGASGGGITWSDLAPHQRAVAALMNPATPYRGLLVYHGLGSGKTLVGISVYAQFMLAEPNRTALFVGKPSLEENMWKQIGAVSDDMLFGRQLASADERNEILRKRIVYVSFEELANRLMGKTQWNFVPNRAASALRKSGVEPTAGGFGGLSDGTVQADSDAAPLLDDVLLVIDESHNLIKQLSKPQYPATHAAQVLLDSIRRAKRLRLLAMTATPVQQEPYEIGVTLNLLKSDTATRFPEVLVPHTYNGYRYHAVDENKTRQAFNEAFIGRDAHGSISFINRERFVQCCRGLISYYPVEFNRAQFAQRVDRPVVRVQMSSLQLEKYRARAADIYAKMQKLSSSGIVKLCSADEYGDGDEDDDDDAAGKERGAGKSNTTSCASLLRIQDVAVSTYADVAKAKRNMALISPKAVRIVDEVIRFDAEFGGKQMVMSLTGDLALSAVATELETRNWKSVDVEELRKSLRDPSVATINHKDWCAERLASFSPLMARTDILAPTRKRFIMLTSQQTDAAFKIKLLFALFNSRENRQGDAVPLVLMNHKFTEGVSLLGTTAVHLMTVPRSKALERQIIARAIRWCSHAGAGGKFPDSWKVHVFRYVTQHPSIIDSSAHALLNATPQELVRFARERVENANEALFPDAVFGGGGRKNVLDSVCTAAAASGSATDGSSSHGSHCVRDPLDGNIKPMSAEYIVERAAQENAKALDMFDDALRDSAVDCAVFASMHDPTRAPNCLAPLPKGARQHTVQSLSDARSSAAAASETADNTVSTEPPELSIVPRDDCSSLTNSAAQRDPFCRPHGWLRKPRSILPSGAVSSSGEGTGIWLFADSSRANHAVHVPLLNVSSRTSEAPLQALVDYAKTALHADNLAGANNPVAGARLLALVLEKEFIAHVNSDRMSPELLGELLNSASPNVLEAEPPREICKTVYQLRQFIACMLHCRGETEPKQTTSEASHQKTRKRIITAVKEKEETQRSESTHRGAQQCAWESAEPPRVRTITQLRSVLSEIHFVLRASVPIDVFSQEKNSSSSSVRSPVQFVLDSRDIPGLSLSRSDMKGASRVSKEIMCFGVSFRIMFTIKEDRLQTINISAVPVLARGSAALCEHFDYVSSAITAVRSEQFGEPVRVYTVEHAETYISPRDDGSFYNAAWGHNRASGSNPSMFSKLLGVFTKK